LPNGTYVVTPNKSGISFTPASLTETINGANQSGANFTATSGSQSTHTVTLNWTASTSTVSGYNVYRSTVNGSGYVKLNSVLVNAATYLDSNVTDGITYFYVATAVDSGGTESADSNQATAVIP
jgi:fibronectin type 3 domain-containing protein